MHDFTDFAVGHVSLNLNTKCRSVLQGELLEHVFENFTIMGRFCN